MIKTRVCGCVCWRVRVGGVILCLRQSSYVSSTSVTWRVCDMSTALKSRTRHVT